MLSSFAAPLEGLRRDLFLPGLRAGGAHFQVCRHQHSPSQLASDFFRGGGRLVLACASLKVFANQVLRWVLNGRHGSLAFRCGLARTRAQPCELVPIFEADRLAC
jgi:hypothetical protein